MTVEPISGEDRARITELLAKATKGPWAACKGGECSCGYIFGDNGVAYIAKTLTLHDDVDPVTTPEAAQHNARLIAEARTALPKYESALQAAEAKIEELREALRPLAAIAEIPGADAMQDDTIMYVLMNSARRARAALSSTADEVSDA